MITFFVFFRVKVAFFITCLWFLTFPSPIHVYVSLILAALHRYSCFTIEPKRKPTVPLSSVCKMHSRDPARSTSLEGEQNAAITLWLLQNQELSPELPEGQRAPPRDLSLRPKPAPAGILTPNKATEHLYQQIKRFPNIFPALWIHCFGFNWLKIREPIEGGGGSGKEKMGGISDGKEWSYTERLQKKSKKGKGHTRGVEEEKRQAWRHTRRQILKKRE